MQVIEKPINEIKPYEKNPRKNDEAVQYVANSIKEFGFKVPIVIDKNGVIVAGHTRYKAAQELGYEKLPCIIADDLTEEQIKAFRIADNKTSEKASWDDVLLKEELTDILGDFDMTEFGFGDFELTILTEDFEPEPYDDELVEEYRDKETEYLMKKRVIVTYKENQEEDVKQLLGLEQIDKVVYDIGELV
jgi:site-specific DNA-methyltransferase (adenine-specific)